MESFPHWCRDGHEMIGFSNGPAEEAESCPVCVMKERLLSAEARVKMALKAEAAAVWVSNEKANELAQAREEITRLLNERDGLRSDLLEVESEFGRLAAEALAAPPASVRPTVGSDDWLACPWCKEHDFDAVGLKIHIAGGFCEHYNALSTSLPRTRQANVPDEPRDEPGHAKQKKAP